MLFFFLGQVLTKSDTSLNTMAEAMMVVLCVCVFVFSGKSIDWC